ncbi:MAG TPA: hypothetical protein VKE40_08375 [Gemmataceae bacterium]|nr:hypothetical protein [Gemmataceae bacterium]
MFAALPWIGVFLFFVLLFAAYSIPLWIFLALIHSRARATRADPASYLGFAIFFWVVGWLTVVAMFIADDKLNNLDQLLGKLSDEVDSYLLLLSPMVGAIPGPAAAYGLLRMWSGRDQDYEELDQMPPASRIADVREPRHRDHLRPE